MLQIAVRKAMSDIKMARALEDDARAKQAQQALEAIAAGARAFADRHPALVQAGLVAAEADMHMGQWIDALARLNRLREAAPDLPAVYRGYLLVYFQHYTQTGDPTLLRPADRHVRTALRLDPRDVTALLDASKLAMQAQDFGKAVRYAEEARKFERLEAGPALRQLYDVHVKSGKMALESGNAEAVERAVQAARAVAPERAGSYLLEARMIDAATGRGRAQRLEQARELGVRAKELAPFDTEIDAFLAKIYGDLALAATATMGTMRPPSDPQRDPETWSKLDAEARQQRLELWERQKQATKQKRRFWREEAIRHLTQSIALDPDPESAAETRRRLDGLQASDPKARRERERGARDAYQLGKDHLRATPRRTREALEAFQESVRLDPRLRPGHLYVVVAAHDILRTLRSGPRAPEEERELAERLFAIAFQSLHALDKLDALEELPLRWYYRGRLHHWRYRNGGGEAQARRAARIGYERFLLLEADNPKRDETRMQEARAFLRSLKS